MQDLTNSVEHEKTYPPEASDYCLIESNRSVNAMGSMPKRNKIDTNKDFTPETKKNTSKSPNDINADQNSLKDSQNHDGAIKNVNNGNRQTNYKISNNIGKNKSLDEQIQSKARSTKIFRKRTRRHVYLF